MRFWLDRNTPRLFFPLIISSIKIPKLKTSDFTEKSPSIAYSGAIYPLQKPRTMSSLLHHFMTNHGFKKNRQCCTHLLGSNDPVSISLGLVSSKCFSQPEVRDLGDHLVIEKNVARLHISVYDPQSGILM